MDAQPTPRQILKGLLRGEPAPRPLLMPLTFALGTKLENLSLRAYQSNPTRIANAQRQIRATLKLDSVTCYCDRYLEVEALGCEIEWKPDGSAALNFDGEPEALRQGLDSPDAILTRCRIPVAVEVLQRLKFMLKDEPALVITVTGPLSLAARLEPESPFDRLELCAGITASVAKKFVESGADLVLLMEDALPLHSQDVFEQWTTLLEPIINVVRFYDALPVLLLRDANLSQRTIGWILDRTWDCALCPTPEVASLAPADAWRASSLTIGVALADGSLGPSESDPLPPLPQGLDPAFLSTGQDLPSNTDLKVLMLSLERLRAALLPAT